MVYSTDLVRYTNCMIEAEQIKEWIEAGLKDSTVTIDGDGHHFEAKIVCPAFSGKGTLQRHRLVYAALGEKMGNEVHALSMKTLAPEEQ